MHVYMYYYGRRFYISGEPVLLVIRITIGHAM